MRIEPVEGDGNLLARSLAVRPQVIRGVNALMKAFVADGLLESSVREFARQAAAPIVGCAYCSTLGDGAKPATPKEALAAEYAVAMASGADAVSDELFARLAEHFDSDEIVELTAWIAYIVIGGQTFGAAIGLPPASPADAEAFQAAVADGTR